MTFHHPIALVAPFVIAAEAGIVSDSWALTVANYGVATGMLGWFMWREKLDRQERKEERAEAQKKHAENLEALREVRDAMRDTINLVTVGMGGMKNMDSNFTTLAERLRTNGEQRKG